jgi:hypothetical protein
MGISLTGNEQPSRSSNFFAKKTQKITKSTILTDKKLNLFILLNLGTRKDD